ncbi:MAG: zinc-binding protein, partial [Massilia sp.]|nr:zinc-binding protein [Massilia sp.]
AMMHARIARVVYAAADPKTGVGGSVLDVFAHGQLNHQTSVLRGVMAAQAGAMLRGFFAERRSFFAERRSMARAARGDAIQTSQA